MTEQEAINTLNIYGHSMLDELNEANKLAIKALEKQIPKKVLIEKDRKFTWMVCPTCRSILSKGQKGFETPCRCGQRLDWSETNG